MRDLDRATELLFAFKDLTTCPMPPAENRLPVAVAAGEKVLHERGGT